MGGLKCLVAISKTTHTRHYSEYVVVYGEYFDYVFRVYTSKVECGIVYAGHVAGTRWLMFFGFESEGVYVDISSVGTISRGANRFYWYTFVVLVRLYKLEILGRTGSETFVSV